MAALISEERDIRGKKAKIYICSSCGCETVRFRKAYTEEVYCCECTYNKEKARKETRITNRILKARQEFAKEIIDELDPVKDKSVIELINSKVGN